MSTIQRWLTVCYQLVDIKAASSHSADGKQVDSFIQRKVILPIICYIGLCGVLVVDDMLATEFAIIIILSLT